MNAFPYTTLVKGAHFDSRLSVILFEMMYSMNAADSELIQYKTNGGQAITEKHLSIHFASKSIF